LYFCRGLLWISDVEHEQTQSPDTGAPVLKGRARFTQTQNYGNASVSV
jgi:hypothetical protein